MIFQIRKINLRFQIAFIHYRNRGNLLKRLDQLPVLHVVDKRHTLDPIVRLELKFLTL